MDAKLINWKMEDRRLRDFSYKMDPNPSADKLSISMKTGFQASFSSKRTNKTAIIRIKLEVKSQPDCVSLNVLYECRFIPEATADIEYDEATKNYFSNVASPIAYNSLKRFISLFVSEAGFEALVLPDYEEIVSAPDDE